MKLSEIPKEDLDLMGYDDIALLILQENGKKMKLRDIFTKVCQVLDLGEDTIDNELVDFFEMLSINKKFIMLENGYWDLQTRHNLDLVFDEEDDEEEIIEDDEEINELNETDDEEDIFYDKDDETDDIVDDEDLQDLAVIDDIDENNL